MNNCHTSSLTGLFGKHLYSGTPAKSLPAHCDCIPMTYVLDTLTYQTILIVHTQVTCLLVKYQLVMGIQQ